MASRFLTRRGLLASSAAAGPMVLAACGSTTEEDEEASPARQAELLNAILTEQYAVTESVISARGNAPTELEPTFERLAGAVNAERVRRAIAKLDGVATDQAAPLAGGESPTEGVARQLEQAIAVSLEAIGELEGEPRQLVHGTISEEAAALAAIRGTLGEKIAPDPFVMGPPAGRAAT